MDKGRRKFSDTVHALNETGASLCGRVSNPNKLDPVSPEAKVSCPSCKELLDKRLNV